MDRAVNARDVPESVVSSSEVVRMTGRDLRYVQRQTRRLGLKPVYLIGERQWSRADALKLILLARLQAIFGETSPLPFDIAEASDSTLEGLLRAPGRGAMLSLPATGINLTVSVPSLAALVGAA